MRSSTNSSHLWKRNKLLMGLIVRSSAIHAAGCYATSAIRKGTRVAEYTGSHMTKAEADERYEELPITYLFGLGDGSTVIDGHCMAMFINHSCDPNCETEEVRGRVWIAAIRNIKPGEEITYDYCLYDGDEGEAACNCGAAECRGTMYSKEEVRRRKAVAKKTSVSAEPSRRGIAKKNGQRRPPATNRLTSRRSALR